MANLAVIRMSKKPPSPTSVRTGRDSSITSMGPVVTLISIMTMEETLPCMGHASKIDLHSSYPMSTGRQMLWQGRSSPPLTTWLRVSDTRQMVLVVTLTVLQVMVASPIPTAERSLSTPGSPSLGVSVGMSKMGNTLREDKIEWSSRSIWGTYPLSSVVLNQMKAIQVSCFNGKQIATLWTRGSMLSCNRMISWIWICEALAVLGTRINPCLMTARKVFWELREWRSLTRWFKEKPCSAPRKRDLSLSELTQWLMSS